jgi:N-acetylglucosaminyldiphosphoundecaprenol N-acetyl-beta-D-mannosaminyltransferase
MPNRTGMLASVIEGVRPRRSRTRHRMPRGRKVDVLGCGIDAVTMEQALGWVEGIIERRARGQHMAVNAAKLVASQDDPRLREIIAGCELVTADGQAVVWASRLLGNPLPERVAGIDLMSALLAAAEQNAWRVYVLGAHQTVLEQALGRIRARHPNLVLAGHRNGYFRASEEAAVVAEIAASRADILFVAMSSPRKEYFVASYRAALGVPFVMGVGGALDVLSGRIRRAPAILQRLGLEWLFRLLQEPHRLFRRYAETNVRFLALVLGKWLRAGLARPPVRSHFVPPTS